MTPDRKLPWDWYPGTIPENVIVDETAWLETSFSFLFFRSRAKTGVRLGRGSSTYIGTMFDVGPSGQVSVGNYTLVNGARIICDSAIEIGDYGLISWNVVLMDSYRLSENVGARRQELEEVSRRSSRILEGGSSPRPIRIGSNVWIGFDACILPGVTIGEGSIVGARSVVFEDVAPFTVVAGNPARVIRRLSNEAIKDERI
jgi:acetyltransferase-like isoleucine patch superfamily enzyme